MPKKKMKKSTIRKKKLIRKKSKSKSTKKSKSGIKILYELSNKKSTDNNKHISNVITVFQDFINYYNNTIKKKKYDYISIDKTIFLDSLNKKVFFILITTYPYNNHPFLVYGFYNNTKFNVLMPMGNQDGQVNIKVIKKKVKTMNSLHKMALYYLLENTIKIRERNLFVYTEKLINTPNSIYNCSNIFICQKSINKIAKMNIDTSQKIHLQNKIYLEIKEMINKHLKRFFELLRSGKHKQGKEYLVKKFNEIYYNTSGIMGHLLIFVEVFKLIDEIKISL